MAGDRERSFVERARRAQIVEAAIGVIAEVGYAKASFAQIATRAGISPGLISYHFDSKDELIDAVVTRVTTAFDAAITAQAATATTHVDVLRTMIVAEVAYFAEHRDEIWALGAIRTGVRDDDGRLRYAVTQHEHAVSQLEEFFADGQAAGEFGPFAPRVMALTLVGALEAVPSELAGRPEADARLIGAELAAAFERATVFQHDTAFPHDTVLPSAPVFRHDTAFHHDTVIERAAAPDPHERERHQEASP